MPEPTSDSRRVLVVGMRPPRLPLQDGYVLHLHHLLSQLNDRHQVTFVAPDDGRGACDDIAGLNVDLADPRAGGLTRHVVDRLRTGNFEVIHVVGAPLAKLLRVASAREVSVLGALDAPHLNVDAVQAFGPVQVVRKRAKRARSLWTIKHRYGLADRVVVVSDQDRTALQEVNPDLVVSVIPNGVDLGSFGPRAGIGRQKDRMVFSGALDYSPNVATAVYLAEKVLPIVRSERPGARLSLVGRDPDERVLALGQIDGVDVVGPVDDMADALSSGSVYVCPMVSGTGIKNKLLEALANGLPCVASTLAIRGTDLTDGTEVLIGDDARGVASATLLLLGDEQLRTRLSEAGRRYVEDHHSWSSVGTRYTQIYDELLNGAER